MGTAAILSPNEIWLIVINCPLLRNFGENKLLLKRNHSLGTRAVGSARRKVGADY